jgi:uncharacterized membrane protein YedE/YeeE
MERGSGPLTLILERPAKGLALAGFSLIGVSLTNLLILSLGVRGPFTWLGIARIPDPVLGLGSAIGLFAGIVLVEVAVLAWMWGWFKTVKCRRSDLDAAPGSK